MSEQEKPLIDRVWEFTKDISVKVSRTAEKHWKINTLRVEIASIRHRINVKYKELGRYVYESVKSQTLEEDSYKASLREFFDELKRLEGEILQRENRIEILEQEMSEDSQTPPEPPPFHGDGDQAKQDVVDAEIVAEEEVSEKTDAADDQTDDDGNAEQTSDDQPGDDAEAKPAEEAANKEDAEAKSAKEAESKEDAADSEGQDDADTGASKAESKNDTDDDGETAKPAKETKSKAKTSTRKRSSKAKK